MKRARFALANMSEMNTKLVKDSRVVSARSFLRTCAVFPMVACLLAIGLPNHVARATASHQQTVFPADTPPTVTEYSIPTANSGSFQITAGPDGNFWFCESRGNKVGRVTTAGVFTEFPLAGGPYGITAGPDGNMWITEVDGNKIARMKPDGSSLTEFPIPTPGSRPSGIAAGPDGNIWFAESEGNKIGRVTVSGGGAGSVAPEDVGTITEFPLPFAGSVPFQLTAGPDGNVWFTLNSASNIGRITPSGNITQFEIPTPNCQPSGITTGPDGNIWFTEYVANKIGRVTVSGTFTEFPISTPNSFPFAITPAGDGNLYYTQQGALAIEQFSPATQTFGLRLPVSLGPSGIFGLPANGGNQFLGFVTADANKFGLLSLIVSACNVMLDKSERFFDALGKSVAILTGHSNCKPPATSGASWVRINEVGFVPETMVCAIDYSVEPNPSTEPRTTTIRFGDQTFTVHQAGAGALPPVDVSPNSAPSGRSGFRLTVNRAGSSSSELTTDAAGFTSTSMVGWNGEDRPTTLVSTSQLTADISAGDVATPGTARLTVFDVSPGGGTSPAVTFTITAGPDFGLGFDQPTVTALAGTKARVTVNINRTGGFTGNVTVTPPDPAGGIKPKPPDPVTTTDSTASFKLKIGAGVTPGPHQLVFTGKDDFGRERAVTLTVIVQ